jgi:hypothetical protein
MNFDNIKDIVATQLVKSGIISEQYIEYPFKVKPKEIEAFLKKYPQVEKSMKPFVSARIMQGYRKWLNWKHKNEDKLGGTPKHMSSPSFGEKTFYNHDFGNIQGWASIFQYITAKQLKDPSLYSSKNESINETTKADIDKQKAELLKKVNVLVDKKKKLYSKVDISSPMSADEKKLDKEIADLFSQINDLTRQKRKLSEGKFAEKVKKAELAHSKGNSKLAKYHLDNAQTFMFGLPSTEIGKNKEYINKYNEMRKIYKESVTESTNTPMMSKSGKDIFVDTTFVQLSNKFGTLEHIWMGDFVVKTKDGDVEFSRVNKQIDGFNGRTHQVSGNPKAINSLIKNMKPKVVKESVNEKNIPKKGTSDYHQHKIAVDTMKNPNKSMMGGPSPKEAEQILMKKFGYSKKEIDKLNESKNDFAARYDKSNILLKKGYKHHTADELEKLYYKLGALVKGLKVKDVSVIFEKLLKTNENLDNYSKDAITDMIINLSRYEGNDKLIADLKKILKQRTLGKLKKEQSVNETFIPKVGRIDDYILKDLLMKNPKVNAVLGDGEKSFMKKSDVVVIMHQSKRFNTIFTDGKQEFEIDMKVGKLVKPLGKARKEIVAHFSKSESVNEASRRATDFYGDSKHGKALHSLLKGKWDSKKVEKFLEKLGDGNDVKYARLIDFISGGVGLNIRKYKTVGEQLPELMKVLETLYTDFLTEGVVESVNERTTKKIKAGTYTGSNEIETLLRSGKWKLIGRNGDEYELMMIEGLTEATITSIPQFNLESDAYIAMFNMLKNNSKFKKVVGTSLLAYMSGGNPKNILTTLRGMLAKGIVTNKLINGTVDVLNKRSPRISVSSQQASTPKIIDQFSGVLAAGLLFDFRENTVDTAKMTGDKNVVNAASDFSVNRGKEKFKTMMGNKFESISESKKVDWKDFYTRAKDTSGYDPSFEKKYGRLLDLPHITDALNKTSDFKSFMKFISKFESVVDVDGMQRAGVALPQTEEEPIEESTAEPKIITQLRDVMKNGYKKLKDPKSGKVMTVDSYSASAIVKVYDALNPTNKEKFSNAGLLGMQSMAFKLIK